MKSVCLCFQVHQPFRCRWYWPREGYEQEQATADLYFDQGFTYSMFEHASRVYTQANEVVRDTGLVCTFNISGTFLDQCKWNPQLLDSFKELKHVEFAASPYYNSLCSLFPIQDEFVRQVKLHRDALEKMLGVKSTTLINTELVHNATVARCAAELGFSATISEGIGGLEDRCCVFDDGVLPFLLRHPRLSEDIEFRFSDTTWTEYPLTAHKFVRWIDSMQGDVLTLYLDYASLGGYHGADSLRFLEELPGEFKEAGIELLCVRDAVSNFEASFYDGDVHFSRNNLAHCLSNHMQHVYLNELKRLDGMQFPRDEIFGYLQQVDILIEMGEGKPHPFDSAINAFSILSDYMRRRV